MDVQAGSFPGWNVREAWQRAGVRTTPVLSVSPGELHTHIIPWLDSTPACTPGIRGVMLSYTSLSLPAR